MSNEQNDKLIDMAMTAVEMRMEADPSIPQSDFKKLVDEEYRLLCLTEPTDIETEMDDDSGDDDFEPPKEEA